MDSHGCLLFYTILPGSKTENSGISAPGAERSELAWGKWRSFKKIDECGSLLSTLEIRFGFRREPTRDK